MERARIGFIGVGLMGHGMARNFLEKGFALTVLGHRNRAPVEDLVARGASEASSPEDLAARSDIVFLCVTGAAQVEPLVRGLVDGAASGLHIVDCSTSEPTLTMALHAELKPLGIQMCDAPLGGTPANAAEGTLSAMVGAEPDAFARIAPAIAAFAARTVHVGAPGAGHTMKLLNNFLSLGYGAIYAEALALAAKVGVTPQTFDSVIRGSRMDCGFYQTYMKYVLERDVNAHRFTLSNAHKDMRYVNNLASATGAANFVGASVKNIYAAAEGLGHGAWNVPQISDVVATLNGVSLGPVPQEE
ncbi:NAD(P)-dependent oxidoreductase [Aquabacter cavernae]|uniref:NAD(P)-dependent oxidoreductase n=1 Tax=Aquabacter cavernae TaxID=2496029 RepID=UPI000F8DA8CF|nr:NAD(P)-dependent oxidoreductase [Aquabacter cavernae]